MLPAIVMKQLIKLFPKHFFAIFSKLISGWALKGVQIFAGIRYLSTSCSGLYAGFLQVCKK